MNTGHAAHFQTGDGTPTEQYVHYVRERAKGGAGIIVTAYSANSDDGETSLSLTNFDDRVIQAFQRMAAATHAYDYPLLAQLRPSGAPCFRQFCLPRAGYRRARLVGACPRFLRY